jgi:hypothetical protein
VNLHDSLAARTSPGAGHRLVPAKPRIINLSLGTQSDHEPLLRLAVARVLAHNCRLIAAGENDGVRWLPGVIPASCPRELDWECPRDGTALRLAPLPGYPSRLWFRARSASLRRNLGTELHVANAHRPRRRTSILIEKEAHQNCSSTER